MPRPVLLAPGVWRIPTTPLNLVNSFALEEADGSVTVVDTGIKGLGPRNLAAGLEALGKRPDQVRRILLTHAHFDHAGGAAGLQRRTGAAVATHDVEADCLRKGRTPSFVRRGPVSTLADRWRPRLERCPVESTFSDGQVLDVAGGLRVLHTPGHTPGHCAFLHQPSGVLITGDSLFNWFDRTTWSFAVFCTDPQMSQDTADRLCDADYEIAAFTHGPEIRDRPREHIREFVRTHRRR